ncbi:hypothetical protein JQ563_48075, partial [Bradyrhizobium liaoningense]|nr:hypothetical protein [Bradyrhizobium liaoningense]
RKVDFSCFGYHPDLESRLTFQEKWVLGPTGGDFIKSILERSSDPASGTIATILGVVTVLITASGVFGEMHTALNATFKAKPLDEPISALLRTRAASLGLVARSAS